VPVARICFVCMGNICRSPTAEVVMRARLVEAGLSDRVVVDSAGTGGWHVGRGADERAVETLQAHGYDGDAHVARQFDPAWFDDRDLIVAMDAENLRALHRAASPDQQAKIVMLRSFDPASDADQDVPDPYYGGADGFENVLALVEAACDGLLDCIRTELT
jgi:protein-tyrosine phosphatase